MSNGGSNSGSSQSGRSGLHMAGAHEIVKADGLMVGQVCNESGRWCKTLTQAKKTYKPGEAIVRVADRKVISIK